MNKVAKVGARSKSAKKVSSVASKPVKKSVKVSASAESLSDEEKRMLEVVSLAEIEVLAAKAVKMIKAKRSASPEEKARKLAFMAEKLERARRMGGMSKGGAWDFKHPFGIMKIIDWEAVSR
jgi:hypothetical protein